MIEWDVYRRCDDPSQRELRNCQETDTLYLYIGSSRAVTARRAISNAAFKKYGDELKRGMVDTMVAFPSERTKARKSIIKERRRRNRSEEQLSLFKQ